MKYLVIFAFAAFGLSQLPAQEKFDYAAAVKLVAERTEIPKPSNSVIYILGPQQNEEVVISNGKETKRTVPFCRAELVAPSGTPLNRLLSTGSVDFIALFGYMLILGIGVLCLCYWKNWPLVNLLSFVCTYGLYFYAMRAYTVADFWNVFSLVFWVGFHPAVEPDASGSPKNRLQRTALSMMIASRTARFGFLGRSMP